MSEGLVNTLIRCPKCLSMKIGHQIGRDRVLYSCFEDICKNEWADNLTIAQGGIGNEYFERIK